MTRVPTLDQRWPTLSTATLSEPSARPRPCVATSAPPTALRRLAPIVEHPRDTTVAETPKPHEPSAAATRRALVAPRHPPASPVGKSQPPPLGFRPEHA